MLPNVTSLCIIIAFILTFRVIDKSMKNFKAFFRWLYVGENRNYLIFKIHIQDFHTLLIAVVFKIVCL